MNEVNHGVALAGVFTALDALMRARSVGKFHYGNPVYEQMAKIENDLNVLIHTVLAEAKKVGVEL